MFLILFKMFKYTNLIYKYSNFSYSGHPFNKIQILNIAQNDIYPRFNDYIKNDKPTNIIVNSGKVLINFKKEVGKGKYDNMVSKILFAEPYILCENKVSTNELRNKSNYNINNEYCNYNDLVNVLTNKKYVLLFYHMFIFLFILVNMILV